MRTDSSVKTTRTAIRLARLVMATLLIVLPTLKSSRCVQADDSPAERRGHVESMSAAQKDALRRKHERFTQLPPAEQERLRELDRELSADSDAAQLKQIMISYHDWLMTSLSPGNRSELLRLEPTARIKRIKELKKQERKRTSRVFSLDDYGIMIRWLRDWVIENEDEILRNIPPEQKRRLLRSKLSESERLRSLVGLVFSMGSDRKIRLFHYTPTMKDFGILASRLSDAARVKLNESSTVNKKLRQVREWLQRTNSRGSRFRPEAWDIEKGDLEEFFRSLNDDDRDQLLSLSVDEFQRQLRLRYLQKQLGKIPQDFRSDSANDRRPRRDGPHPKARFRGDKKRPGPPRNSNRGPRNRPGFERPPKVPPNGGKAR